MRARQNYELPGFFIYRVQPRMKRVGSSIRVWRPDREPKYQPKGFSFSGDVWVKASGTANHLTDQATRNSQGSQGALVAEDLRKTYTEWLRTFQSKNLRETKSLKIGLFVPKSSTISKLKNLQCTRQFNSLITLSATFQPAHIALRI